MDDPVSMGDEDTVRAMGALQATVWEPADRVSSANLSHHRKRLMRRQQQIRQPGLILARTAPQFFRLMYLRKHLHQPTLGGSRATLSTQKALTQFNDQDFPGAMTSINELLRLESGHEDAKTLQLMTQRKLTPLTGMEEAEIRRLYLRGMRFYSNNEYTEAIAEWQKILTIDPTNESVRRNIKEAKGRLSQLGN